MLNVCIQMTIKLIIANIHGSPSLSCILTINKISSCLIYNSYFKHKFNRRAYYDSNITKNIVNQRKLFCGNRNNHSDYSRR
jgi:hypothetical protein